MTGTLMLSRLVRDDVMKDLVFTGRILPASEGAPLGLVTRLADDPLAAAMDAAREIAGRSPSAVRGAKQLINRISNVGAAEHFAAEREIIFTLIGKPHPEVSSEADLCLHSLAEFNRALTNSYCPLSPLSIRGG
jgi:enoyl-CoA hydratase/carnithine racemase